MSALVGSSSLGGVPTRQPEYPTLPFAVFEQGYQRWLEIRNLEIDERLRPGGNNRWLHAMHFEVVSLGGARKVTANGQWPLIAQRVEPFQPEELTVTPGATPAAMVQDTYAKYLQEFEDAYLQGMMPRSLQGKNRTQERLPSSENAKNVREMIEELRATSEKSVREEMPFVEVPVKDRLEYNVLCEQAYLAAVETEQELYMMGCYMPQEGLVKLIELLVKAHYQRQLLGNVLQPEYILTLQEMSGVATQLRNGLNVYRSVGPRSNRDGPSGYVDQ